MENVTVWGNREDFKLILSIVDDEKNYSKEIYGYEIPGVGVAMAFQGEVNQNAYASGIFIPGASIEEITDTEGAVIARKIVKQEEV